MSPKPPIARRRSRAVTAGTTLTAALSVALLTGTLSPAAAQPVATSVSAAAFQVPAATLAPSAPSDYTVVTMGQHSRRLTGTNITRKWNRLVVFKAPKTYTPRTRRGVDVVVVGGKVAKVNVRRPGHGRKQVKVPRGGYVVSGAGTSASWLRAVGKGGRVVAVERRTTTQPVSTAPATDTLVAGRNVTVGSGSYTLAGVNVERGINALVAYRSSLTVTPTNMWGIEVSVVNGRVTAMNDRQLSGSEVGTTIPAGGYVLSGHDQAGDWLRANAQVGTVVSVGGSTPMPSTPVPTTPAPVPTTPVPTTPASSTPIPSTPVPTTPVSSSDPMGLPSKVQALYHMMWSNSGSPQLRNLPSQVNVVNLAFLQGDAPSIVGWGSQSEASFIADANAMRARGVRMVISVGGAGGHVNLASRETFVQGVMRLNAKLPLDGIDWDIEGGTAMAASDVVWISKRLKELRGNDFAVTLAPNGSNIDHYRAIAVQLQQNNALDMIGQQFYDAVVSKEAAKGRVAQLVSAGIPQSKIGVGMMVGDAAQYWTVEECIQAVQFIKASYPGIRGGYLWEAGRAGTSDWSSRMSSLLKG